jgi:PAS domain S-box-containing protein
MIDEMNEGAVSLSTDSLILYSNRNFAGILGLAEANMSGASLTDYIVPQMRDQFVKDLEAARDRAVRRQYTLCLDDGRQVPVLMSFAKLQPQTNSISLIVTDLTAQKEMEAKLRHAKEGLEELVEGRTKELRESEARLFKLLEHSAADLKAMRRLNEIGAVCAQDHKDVDACLKEVLNVAIEICGADKGNIQLVDEASGAHTVVSTPVSSTISNMWLIQIQLVLWR